MSGDVIERMRDAYYNELNRTRSEDKAMKAAARVLLEAMQSEIQCPVCGLDHGNETVGVNPIRYARERLGLGDLVEQQERDKREAAEAYARSRGRP